MEGVDEEDIPRERDEADLGAKRVLKVDSAMFDVVAAPEQQLSLSVEF